MKISFHGAARTVTGSKHLLHLDNGKKVLLDCGMFQGLGKETIKLNSEWGFEPTEIDYVIISHAHVDHTGLLPKLVKDGYQGPIYCTPATASLAKLLLIDSAHIQEADVRFLNKDREREGRPLVEPLYTEADATNVFPLFETIPYNERFKIENGLELLYTDCGHILGSAAVNLRITYKGKETKLTFSGDIGRYRDMILKSPDVFPQADYIIMESTYGDKLHDLMTTSVDKLHDEIVRTCIEQKGKLIVPAFSLGRTQEILYLLNRLELENRLPKLNYYVDSPLSVKVTNAVKQYPDLFNRPTQKLLLKDQDVFAFTGLKYIEEVEDSMNLNTSTEPCVIISASGMAEAGRVKHHIAHNVSDARNTIMLTGYCEPASLGAKLKLQPSEVRIFGRMIPVKASITEITSLSAHGDYEDMSQWLGCQNPREVSKIFLVHGEYDVQMNFQNRLIKKGFRDVEIPSLHQMIGLGE
ncbi:MBL fold metallo-hydrolase [Polluticoccus soli]|uniref:MBL fold metallo-hydrolase n=1 Tax=Polluticoccus soli TaxID=3034150 RepID=UPI0023E12A09|nr:MBL fold metallo-hydrolase [Flavipsychrobacter sp. JY13-12]